ncbi:hypothetical protein AB1Y20_015386 [Prymnesium parvum]|uniref:UVR domain-containing protein n=1 Tax=Prymnesium parvum TaxID=97485 RepID=A0AB34JY84_PRYPA
MLLSYRVVGVSSEDEAHPARELQRYSADSRGWQSTRWCEFPQELVLQFQGRVMLQQVQVLSHQFKIASRVELFMGSLPPGTPPPVTGCAGANFSRLGHFSLDSNERSKFQARELKTVYVPQATEGLYLRLVLHKCHVNEYNLYSQIGVLAVRAIGSGPGAMSAQHAEQRDSMPALSAPPAYFSSDALALDPATAAMVAELQRKKDAAVRAEDYDEAKLLKDKIAVLQKAGAQIAELERRKQDAVAREDYDLAKRLKQQLSTLREEAGLPPAAANAQLSPAPPPHDYLGGAAEELRDVAEIDMLRRQEERSREEAHARIEAMAQQLVQPAAAPPPAAPTRRQSTPAASSPHHSARDDSPPPDEAAAPRHEAAAPRHEAAAPRHEAMAVEAPARAARAKTQRAHDERPVAALAQALPEQPRDEEGEPSLPEAEPLSPQDAKDAAIIVEVYGEEVARKLYSKSWNLRQAAAAQMSGALASLAADARALAQATCKAVGRCAHDKMVQVFLAGMQLFDSLLRDPRAAALSPSDWSGMVMGNAAIVDTFRAKLADGNARVRDAVEAAFLQMARLQSIGPQQMAAALLVPIDPKKSGDTRLWLGRLGVVQQLFSEFGERHLLNHIDGAMAMVKKALESSSGVVRSKAMELALELYHVVGDLQQMTSYLTDLKHPAIRDSLMAAFEAASVPQEAVKAPPLPRGGVGTPLAAGRAATQAAAGRAEYPHADEQTCQFCGRHDPDFDDEKMDLHYWKECPMLMPCEQCGQVVEVASLAEHLVGECDQSHPFKYQPPLGVSADYTGCPLCAEELPEDPDACRAHIMQFCPGNKRRLPA